MDPPRDAPSEESRGPAAPPTPVVVVAEVHATTAQDSVTVSSPLSPRGGTRFSPSRLDELVKEAGSSSSSSGSSASTSVAADGSGHGRVSPSHSQYLGSESEGQEHDQGDQGSVRDQNVPRPGPQPWGPGWTYPGS